MCKLEPSQLISSDSSTNASSTGQKLEVCFVLLSLNKWSLAFQEHSDLSSQYGKTCCLHLMDVKNCSDLKAQKVKSPVKMKIWKQQNIADLLCLVEKNSLGARRCCSSLKAKISRTEVLQIYRNFEHVLLSHWNSCWYMCWTGIGLYMFFKLSTCLTA